MRELGINYIAILISAVLAMVIGSLWYSRSLFGKEWIKLAGLSEADTHGSSNKKGNMPILYGSMFVGAIVEAYVLSYFMQYAGAYGLINGIKVGIWAWLGFVAATSLGNTMFEQRPIKLWYINAGYALVNLIVMGATISLVRSG